MSVPDEGVTRLTARLNRTRTPSRCPPEGAWCVGRRVNMLTTRLGQHLARASTPTVWVSVALDGFEESNNVNAHQYV